MIWDDRIGQDRISLDWCISICYISAWYDRINLWWVGMVKSQKKEKKDERLTEGK